MVKGIGITVVIDKIKNEEDISIVMQNLSGVLPEETRLVSTEEYTKFPDAWKLEYLVSLSAISDKEKIIYDMLLLSESIARPWLIYFDKDGDNTELIFNRDTNTSVTQHKFSPIRWAHIQLIY